jgi:molybdate transport system substrate-binding protein
MKKFVMGFAAVVLAGQLAACSSDKKASAGNPGNQTLTVFAAASLKNVLTGLAPKFEAAHPGIHVVFNFAASSTLAASITQGAAADVFASASEKDMDTTVRAGAVSTPTPFASNRITLALPKDNPAHVSSIADLNKSSVKFATCNKLAPCGVAATETLIRAGVTRQPVTYAADAKATVNLIQLDEVDAGFVYSTDVLASKGALLSIQLDDSLTVPTHYPVAAVKTSTHADLGAAFVALLTGPDGQQALQAAGFGRP